MLSWNTGIVQGMRELVMPESPKTFRILDHTADVGLEAYGSDLPEMLANAARGMFEIIASPQEIRPEQEFTIEIVAEDSETLLHDWLDELLYLYSAKRVLLCRFDLSRTDSGLQGKVFGESIDPNRHELYSEIKAVTYHELAVMQNGDEWLGRVIFDI